MGRPIGQETQKGSKSLKVISRSKVHSRFLLAYFFWQNNRVLAEAFFARTRESHSFYIHARIFTLCTLKTCIESRCYPSRFDILLNDNNTFYFSKSYR